MLLLSLGNQLLGILFGRRKLEYIMESITKWFEENKKKSVAGVIAIVTIVFLPLIKDVISFEYAKYRNSNGNETIENSKRASSETNNLITKIDVSNDIDPILDSINQYSKMWEKSYRDLSDEYKNSLKKQNQERATFAYLEGNSPENNYGVFLESYYGINNRAKMGNLVVDSLIDREIRWALRIEKIRVLDDPKAIYVLFSPIKSVCEKNSCPKDFDDRLVIQLCDCEATRNFLQDTREGDFVYLEGVGCLWESEGNDIQYRHRFSPRITQYRYRPHQS